MIEKGALTMNNSEEKQLLVAFETMINTADEALAEKLIQAR